MIVLYILLLFIQFTQSKQQEIKQIQFCSERHPIFLFHGIIGSAINADLSLTNAKDLPEYCQIQGNDISLWISPLSLVPKYKNCIPKYLQMEYDEQSQSMKNRDGVNTYYATNTSVEGISNLTPNHKIFSSFVRVFADIVDHLEVMGYTDTDDLQAAAYDWRIFFQNNQWKKDLKQRIESIVKKTGKKVVFIGHSMGGLVIHDYLEEMKQSWIDRYIHKVITISTPWNGSVKALRALMSGDNLGLSEYILSNQYFLNAIRSFESVYALLPKETREMKDKIIITIDDKEYTINQIIEEMKKMSEKELLPSYAKELLKYTKHTYFKRNREYQHLCIYGNGIETEHQLKYSSNLTLLSKQMKKEGDGTVELSSLKGCSLFDEELTEMIEIENESHLNILENKIVIQRIQEEVCNSDEYNSDPLTLFEKIKLYFIHLKQSLSDSFYDLIQYINNLIGFEPNQNSISS